MEINNNSRKNMIMAITVASVFLFACTQVPVTVAQIGNPACTATTAQNILDVVNLCVLPTVPATGATPDCCTAAQKYDLTCSCSPVVLNLVGLRSLITFRDLLAKANYCNKVTLQQVLVCLGSVRLP